MTQTRHLETPEEPISFIEYLKIKKRKELLNKTKEQEREPDELER